MRVRALLLGAASALLTLATFVGPAAAQTSPCPPGQPFGTEPGEPPSPRQRPGRPAQYPIEGKCALRLRQNVVTAGSSVFAEGEGFAPGSTVAMSLRPGGQVTTFTANSAGAIAGDIPVSGSTAAGTYQAAATGVAPGGAPYELTAELSVVSKAAPAATATNTNTPRSTGVLASLARTGADNIVPLSAVGAALTVVGAIAVIGSRRRRNTVAG